MPCEGKVFVGFPAQCFFSPWPLCSMEGGSDGEERLGYGKDGTSLTVRYQSSN